MLFGTNLEQHEQQNIKKAPSYVVVQKMHSFGAIWFSNIIKNIYARTAPSIGAIWHKFSEQYQHQNIKKSTIL